RAWSTSPVMSKPARTNAQKAQKRAALGSVGSQSRLLRVSARVYRVQPERRATYARARSITCVLMGFAMVLHLPFGAWPIGLGWYAQPASHHRTGSRKCVKGRSAAPTDVLPMSSGQ